MRVDIRRGATIVMKDGKPLYALWPDGRRTVDGREITKAEAKKLEEEKSAAQT